ncbi:fimbrial protein [Avibacterium paragallinarum]|uniref:fimbrial protein n=1 Tax=Avibacterium paragallinarum TaxID=728 RepID=UPI00397AD9B9
MKKLLLTTLITVGLGLSAQGAFAADSTGVASGTVNFTGKVQDMTCTIEDGADKNVVLDTVQVANFTGQGTTAAPKPFNIVLKDCTRTLGGPITSVYAYFENEPSKVDRNGLLMNTANSSPATGVAVQLLRGDGTAIKVTDDELTQAGNQKVAYTAGNSVTFKYIARYYATAASVTPGPVKASVKYNLAYE